MALAAPAPPPPSPHHAPAACFFALAAALRSPTPHAANTCSAFSALVCVDGGRCARGRAPHAPSAPRSVWAASRCPSPALSTLTPPRPPTHPRPGDEMFADSYPMREVEDGFFFEVDGKVRRRGRGRGRTRKRLRASIGPPLRARACDAETQKIHTDPLPLPTQPHHSGKKSATSTSTSGPTPRPRGATRTAAPTAPSAASLTSLNPSASSNNPPTTRKRSWGTSSRGWARWWRSCPKTRRRSSRPRRSLRSSF